MIQRIQTLYLLGVAILSSIMLSNPLVSFFGDNGVETITFNAFMLKNASGNMLENTGILYPMGGVLLIIVLLSLIAIFSFKKRALQVKLTIYLIILLVVAIGLIAFYATLSVDHAVYSMKIEITSFFAIISLILSYLALRAIRKDDALVKSFDRIR